MKTRAAFANGAWLASSLPAWARFRRALREPGAAQARILHRLLAANAGTEYGQAHGFGNIGTYAQFRRRVPIVDYGDLEPWIERIVHGEPGVLTREPPTRLVPTSGSTAGRKLIPFTAGFQRELNAAIGAWMVDLCGRHSSVPFGPAYWSISPAIPACPEVRSAVPIGIDDDSSYLGGWKQRLAEATFAVPSGLSRVADIECSRYLTLLCLLRAPELRLISVWHPSFLTLMLEALPRWWEELLDDIATGGCCRANALPLPRELRDRFAATPQPLRAQELRSADPSKPEQLWPYLAVVSCWGDGQAALPFAALQRRLPHAGFQAKGLLATEAFVSIPFAGLHPIAVTSHFFEFEDSRGGVWLAPQLRRGETYTVIVTTAGGLYRYRLGDLVEVDGAIGTTPSLRFIGRGAGVSDLCGEKLTEVFVTHALQAACAASGFAPRFAMLAPAGDTVGRRGYTLFVEGDLPRDFPAIVDDELRANPHYALCRDLGQLDPLGCFQVAGNAYQIFCEAIAAEGRRVGDIKPQALSIRADWERHFTAAQPADWRIQRSVELTSRDL